MGLNLGVHRSGDLAGSITENGVPLQVIVAGGKSYVKATSAFLNQLRQPASICTAICGKWIELPANRAKQLTQSLSLANLTRALRGQTPRIAGTSVTAVAGHQAYQLRASDGATLSVAANGTHYPLVVTGPHGDGTVRFSQWNSVPAPSPPPKGQTINVSIIG